MTIVEVAVALAGDSKKKFRRPHWPDGWYFGSDRVFIVDHTGRFPNFTVIELRGSDWEEVDALPSPIRKAQGDDQKEER